MTRLIPLDDRVFVAGQIAAGDMADVAAAGVTLIVNNRPDHEDTGQPTGEEIQRAAEMAGLSYRFIPIAGGISPGQVTSMAEALDKADGKVLAYCRSGTRSTYLWALARASRGAEAETLIVQAAAAGYDLTSIRLYLR